jgi:hypothetical protein
MRNLTKNGMKKLIGGTTVIGGMIASAALAVGCGTEDSAQAPANQEIQRPAQPPLDSVLALPAGYVETPFGQVHKSCVHEVPDGAEIGTDGAIRRHNQVLSAPPPCAFKRIRVARRQIARDVPGESVDTSGGENVARQSQAVIDGWVVSVEASANNLGVFPPRFNGIESMMTVPPTPTVQLYQLIYLFVSLTPADGKTILQPVLQWGGDTGNKWVAAGWHINRAETVYHSTRVNVTAGETIKGTIRDVRNSCVGTTCAWDVKLWRGATAISSLRANDTEAYSVAQKAVLEAWDLTACRQLPSGNVAYFQNTKVYAPYDPSNVDARIDVTNSLNWRKVANVVSPSCNFNAVFPNPQTAVLTWTAN